jgi:hypothetical protein
MTQRKITSASINDNIEFNGSYIKVPSGTTVERPESPNNGMVRYNTDTGYLENYINGGWSSIATPPSIISISPTTYNGNSGTAITINGSSFDSNAVVKFISNSGTEYIAGSVTFVNAGQLVATTPENFTVSQEPFSIKVTNSSGLSYTLSETLDCGGLPAWSTASGSLGSFSAYDAVNLSVVAVDPEGGDVDYAVTSGSLPSGVSFTSETGAINGTAPDIDNDTTYTFSVVPDDGVNNGSSRSFSVGILGNTDTYFKNTSLLIHSDGTNGAQNNTFIDSSANNYTVTKVNSIRQGSFNPFAIEDGKWSYYVDTSGSDYVTLASGNPLLNAADWTVEFWLYPLQYVDGQGLFGASNGGGSQPKVAFQINGSNISLFKDGSPVLNASKPSIATWTHVAISRSSNGNGYIYYNGVLQTSGTLAQSTVTNPFQWFTNGEGGTSGVYGYISNGRVSNIARYTGSNFTPPTTPYTTDANTVSLTLQSNRLVDKTEKSLSSVGKVSAMVFSPFARSAIYNNNLGSCYQVNISDTYNSFTGAVNAVRFTGDFTIEAWIYPTVDGGDTSLYVISDNSNYLAFNYSTSNGNYNIYLNNASPTSFASGINLNSWNHVALVRSGSTITAYTNGVSKGTLTNSSTLGYSNPALARNGGGVGGTRYMSNIRIVNGTAVYTSNFTPPTTPLTAITNTALLLNYTNSAIVDTTTNNTIETGGAAQISTSVKKFGSGSVSFNGSDSYLFSPANGLNQFATGDFTLEAFIYFNSVGNGQIISAGNGSATNAYYWQYYNNQLQFGIQGVSSISNINWSPSANTWYHIAVTRSGSTVRQFVNGSEIGSASSSQNFVDGPTYIGYGGAGYFNGYMDEIRITKGIARYTGTYAIPTRSFRDR